MKRKIIRLGTATNVVSLPSKWIKRLGLKPGDEVDAIEDGECLNISSKLVKGKEITTVNVTKLDTMINYSILALYIRGVDEVRLESDNPKMIEKLQEHPLPELIGWEIIEQSRNHCLIKDVSGSTDMEIDAILSRVMILIQNMADEVEKALKTEVTDLSHIDSIDVSVNRFINLYERKLQKSGHSEANKTTVMFYILSTLETIGDSYRDAADYISENELTPGKNITMLLAECNTLFRDYRKILIDFKTDDAVNLDRKYRKFRKRLEQDINSIKNPKELRLLIFVNAIADNIASMMRNQLIISLK